jgi:hypothetical protein
VVDIANLVEVRVNLKKDYLEKIRRSNFASIVTAVVKAFFLGNLYELPHQCPPDHLDY